MYSSLRLHVFVEFNDLLISVLLPRYVALISGMGIGSDNHNHLALQMFIDLITGQLGSSEVAITQ